MSGSDDNRVGRIAEDGSLQFGPQGPLTWDGEPLYCADTVRETLFAREAFTQLRGQTSMGVETDPVQAAHNRYVAADCVAPREHCYCPDDCACRKPWRTTICGCKGHDDVR